MGLASAAQKMACKKFPVTMVQNGRSQAGPLRVGPSLPKPSVLQLWQPPLCGGESWSAHWFVGDAQKEDALELAVLGLGCWLECSHSYQR
mmetsp:Transcript_103297/g.188396  ORF Transcript_103297/g.188396 Transcript_103297/m.188396 type:complete len:90 (-) Transcript_103297:78-347(-)